MLSIHGQSKPYMCTCKSFFKTKQDLQQHVQTCTNNSNQSSDQSLNENVSLHHLCFSITIYTRFIFIKSDEISKYWTCNAYWKNEIINYYIAEKNLNRIKVKGVGKNERVKKIT